jgi:hypothetical protein
MRWRSRLSRSSSAAMRVASCRSVAVSSRAPSAASPMRPPALMRGPTRKQVIGRRRAAGAGDVEQGGQAGALALAHRLQAARDEGAVEADQRHHVGDSGERDQIELLHQVGRGGAGLALAAVEIDQRHEHDPGGAEMAEAGEIVLPVRIDQGQRRRQDFRRLMVVENDDVEPEPCGLLERLEADRPAIDGDDEIGPLRLKLPHRFDIGAVALADPIGDVDERLAPDFLEIFAEQGRRTGAVDVVVAEDGDALAMLERVCEPRGGGLHVDHLARVRHQVAQRRLEMALDRVEVDSSAGENAGEEVAAAGQLRNGQGARLSRRIEPGAPGAAGQRGIDIQEISGARHGLRA